MLGMFDSGSGGLTVLHALREKAPRADIIYFGDIANAPYGEKSPEELAMLTRTGVALLRARGARAVVSACNSVSTSVLQGAAGETPFIEMSRPTAEAMRQYEGQRFLLIATPATVRSGLYQSALRDIVSIDALPIAGLAGAIEFGEPETTTARLLHEAFAPRRSGGYDGLLLGCTHYPLIRPQIETISREYFGELLVVDPAHAVAGQVCMAFDTKGSGATTLLISQESTPFRQRARNLVGPAASIEVLYQNGT